VVSSRLGRQDESRGASDHEEVGMTEVGTRGPLDRPAGKSGRVIVLGATGFVGRHASAALEAAGGEVLAVARRPGKMSASRAFHPIDLVADGPQELVRLIDAERPAVVINAAGVAWSPSAARLRQGNQLLVDRLLAALDAADWRPRLVHIDRKSTRLNSSHK
jgi:nucleoside-diphosphate-sugar epimerase